MKMAVFRVFGLQVEAFHFKMLINTQVPINRIVNRFIVCAMYILPCKWSWAALRVFSFGCLQQAICWHES